MLGFNVILVSAPSLCRYRPLLSLSQQPYLLTALLVENHLSLLKIQQKIFITLEDISSSTVLNLLQFLYLGEVTVNESDAENLHQLCLLLKIDFGQGIISIPTKQNSSGRSKVTKNPASTYFKEPSLNPHSPERNSHHFTKVSHVDKTHQSKSVPLVKKDTRLYCYCQKPTSKDLIGQCCNGLFIK